MVSYSHEEIASLADAGSIVVIVDGLSLADVEQFNLFRETTEKFFPKVRFIHFVNTEKRGVDLADNGDPNLFIDQDEIFEFSQLEVSDIREMVSLWRPGTSEDAINTIAGQAIETFRQMDEPIFATSIAVVVETLSQDPDFKPLNKSRLLERYVECLLGRFDLEDVQVGTFASSDKIDMLGYIARELLETNQVGFDEEAWVAICRRYQEDFLLELPKGLLEEFIEKGILTLSDGKITFRGDYLFSFFVARQMKADPTFAESLLEGDGVFKYYREIVFYGELEGTDIQTVLDRTYLRISEVEEVLLENYSRDGVNLLEEWDATCSEGIEQKDKGAALNAAADRLSEAKPSSEHADRVSDDQLAQVQRRRGIWKRVAVQEAEAQLLVIMRLYALLIKNALQLPAADKLRHIRKLYGAGEVWTGFLCARRADIGTRPVVMAGGIRFINYVAALDPEKSAREFKYNAPNSLSRILAEAIRNPQLSVALRRVLPDLNPMEALFARDALLEVSGADNRDAYIESLLNEKNIDLVTGSLRTLRTRFLASGRSKEKRAHIEQVVSKLEIASSSNIGMDFGRLKKARMVRDLKENATKKRDSD